MEDKKDFKTPEYQLKAAKKWKDKNKKYAQFTTLRSQARRYARKFARSIDDIKELEEIFKNENENFDGRMEND